MMDVVDCSIEKTLPLSVAQESLWFLGQMAPDQAPYNESITIRKDGPFDLPAFRAAFNEVARRHEAWRTTFDVVGGQPVQVVHPPSEHSLPLLDLGHLPRDRAERRAAHLAAEVAKVPYDLLRGPLLRPRLVRFGEDHHRLYLGLHHLIFDGVSVYRVVLSELATLYEAFRSGEQPSPLPESPTQYGDYVRWERAWAAEPRSERRMLYWRRHLDGVPVLDLPLDHQRRATPRFRGRMVPVNLSKATVERLRAVGRSTGATLFQVLATTWAVLLSRYSGQEEVVFATPVDLRRRPELESVVGYCLTPLVLRPDLSGDASFAELVVRVRNELVDGLDHLVPFERLVRELHPDRGLRANPIFQTSLTLEPPAVWPDASWSIHQMQSEVGNAIGHAKFDLSAELDERPDGHLAGRLIYDTDLFDALTGSRMAEHWIRLIEGLASNPTAAASAVPILTPAEEQRQVVEWNATAIELPGTGVHCLIEERAARQPDAPAVTVGDETISYIELDRRANGVAHRLRSEGVCPGDIVAVCAERSIELLVGLLGVLKADAAYLPLDPALPAQRLDFMVADSGAKTLLAPPALASRLTEPPARVLPLERSTIGNGSYLPPPNEAVPDAVCYVLYTSGSTGRPKGVAVRHSGVVNLVASMAREVGIGSSDTALSHTTVAFDASVIELWLPLVHGARVVIAPREVATDGRRLAQLITDAGVTFLQATPATWRLLIDSGWAGAPTLRALSGGEPLSPELAELVLGRCAVLWNEYGPTETTVNATLARVERSAPVTIGRPIANTHAYVVDRRLQPVPVGVRGELLIGGAGVAAGYLNRPELTAERFIADPFRPGSTAYRSGDLARWLPDGSLEHLGRVDHQIKLRGFRIEPGEVESVLLAQPGVTAAVVVAREAAPGDGRLVAYLTVAGTEAEPAMLRQALRERLPDYMVPSAFVILTELPRNPNGKLDRSALPGPESSPPSPDRPQPPVTALERRLAAIWARTLGSADLGVEDNFFDVGGHSLLAARLVAQVERQLGVWLPLSAMLETGATVRGMARLIERAGAAPTAGEVDPDIARPLFLVFPHDWGQLALRHFAGVLGPDRPVVPLVIERDGWRYDPSRSVEELAEPIMRTICQTQPHGPYAVAGYSLGGVLAYEVANQLQAADQEVEWVGILDTTTPQQSVEKAARWLTFSQHLVRRLRMGPRATLRIAHQMGLSAFNDLRVALHLRPLPVFDYQGAIALLMKYRCRPNDAPMTLFVTPESLAENRGDPLLGWDGLHGGPLEVVDVPGTHDSVLRQPDVGVVAERLADSLRRADGRQAPVPVER